MGPTGRIRHNDHHHHSGLALFTPADVFHGRVAAVAAIRQATLDAAYLAHPERFPNAPPRVRLPPDAVFINPMNSETVAVAGLPSTEVSSAVFATSPYLPDGGVLAT